MWAQSAKSPFSINPLIPHEWSTSKFSSQYQYIIMQTGQENIDNHQLEELQSWCNTKFSEPPIRKSMKFVGRINDLSFKPERNNTTFYQHTEDFTVSCFLHNKAQYFFSILSIQLQQINGFFNLTFTSRVKKDNIYL